MTAKLLSDDELFELHSTFSYLTNYDVENPCAPIDPTTYVAPDGDTCLHFAARLNNVRAIQLLLKAGLDINTRGDMQETALHCAYASDSFEAKLCLIEHGADKTAIDSLGTHHTNALRKKSWKSNSDSSNRRPGVCQCLLLWLEQVHGCEV